MKKTFKKALAVLLVAVMVFGSAPLAGFVGIELPAFNLSGTKAEAATSGYFNYSVSNNQATITGVSASISGSVTIPATLGGYPVTSIGNWAFDDCDGLTSITIPDSVTSIGNSAFSGCTGLTSITIPDSVTSIGNSAFSGCTRLKSVTIPDSVTSIGSEAFYTCARLTSITVDVNNPNYSSDEYGVLFNKDKTELIQYPIGNERTEYIIPDSVTSIGDWAFEHCIGLTSVTIPDSVTSIGDNAFYNCIGLTSVTIPDSVTSIGYHAFICCIGLTSVTIPDSVTSIGNSAFSGCTGLTSVTIGNGVTSIGDKAFEDCTGLTSITVDESNPNYSSDESGVVFNKNKTKLIQYPIGNERTEYIIPNSVTSIGEYAFYDCSRLASVTIGNSVTSIGEYAFYDCSRLESVTIGNSVTSIGGSAFSSCSALTSVTIGNSVTSIGLGAFTNTGIYKDSSNWENGVLYIGNYLIKADSTISGKYLIKPGIKVLADYAFSGCTGLTSITIPDSVTSIGDWAFYGCTGLKSVTIPDSVTSIGDNAFYNCIGLTSVTIPDSVTSIGYRAFFYCTGLTSVTIPDSVTSIGDYAFDGCNNLSTTYYVGTPEQWRDISIGSNNDPINRNIIFECNTERPYYQETCGKNLTWTLYTDGELVIDGTGDMTDYSSSSNVPWYSKSSKIKSATIGNGVTSIGDRAFYYCAGLTSVTIPDSVTSIGNYAFYGCNNLSTTYYTGTPEQWRDISIGSNNDPINGNIIFECNSERPNYDKGACGDNLTWTLYTDGELVIDGTGDMTDYSGGSNVPWYSKSSKIKSATIGNGVTSIGDWAFEHCTGLTSVTIPDGVTSIGSSAFYNTGIYNDSSNWENGVLHIGNYLIKAKTTISGAYTIKSGTKAIADDAFYNCTALTSVTIPDSVTSIGDGAFSGCNNIATTYYTGTPEQWRDISIGSNNNPINGNIIFECNSERPNYGKGACGDNLTWTLYTDGELVIDGTGDMTDYSGGSNVPWYSKSSKIKSATIGNGVTSIGNSAFYGCTGLTSVTIPDSVTSIGNYAFKGCTGLTSVTIPDSVTSIGNYAFYGCTGLKSVTIPDSVTSIGDWAFEHCTGLTSVTIPDSITSIGNSAFYGCTGLTSVTIPDSITNIGNSAFYGCTGLTSVTIPDSVTSIGNYAFYGCTGLTSVTIPDSITSIGNSAFYGCTGLTSVTIPDSVTSIGNYAFDGCNNLSTTYYVGTPEQWRDISIGSYNGSINRNIIFEYNSERPYYQGTCGKNFTWTLYTDGELVIVGTGDMTDYSSSSNAPWYSKRLTVNSVTIGNGITSIGDRAFSNYTGLTSITIPDSVTSIGDYAFYGCTNLEKIAISAYSVEIADNAFDNSPRVIFYCKSGSTVQSYAELNDIMYILIDGPASGFAVKNNQLVAYKGESENPQLPSGVTSIGSNAFKDNSTVKTVELPNSVSSIFSGAFSNCSSLERIVVPHTVTTIAPDAFNGTNATIVCYANSYAHQYAVEKGMNFELISITLNQTKVILSVGEYSIITATPEQEYLDSVQTSWKSSDTGVATVDANGKVTALSNGTATIYALAPTGETLATCSVQVGYSFRITIQNPSTKTISYKSGIILHATADNLPAGAKIVWEKDNDNFSMSDDGNGNCKIISKANGSTTFTVKVKLADGSIAKDSNGNEISAQVTMNSKAGFFDKIVAFFKGLFGGNKVLPQLFKGIF